MLVITNIYFMLTKQAFLEMVIISFMFYEIVKIITYIVNIIFINFMPNKIMIFGHK